MAAKVHSPLVYRDARVSPIVKDAVTNTNTAIAIAERRELLHQAWGLTMKLPKKPTNKKSSL